MLNDNQIEILITKFFSGEASPKEAMQLDDWVKMSPSNESYFNTSLKIISMTIDTNYGSSKYRVWENIKGEVQKNTSVSKAKVINWRLTGIAASIVLLLSIGLLITNVFKKGGEKILYQAGTSSKKILLKDSSEIIVSPNSSITIDREYGISNRKIKLNGSAYFSIIHNPVQTVIIDMDMLHIKDIGTVFNVVTVPAGDTVFINVIEGEVSVYDDFGSIENTSAGEKVIYIKAQKKLQIFHAEQTKEISPDDPTITKQDKRKIEPKDADTAIKSKTHSIVPRIDLQTENYPYPSYPSQYPLKGGYTPEGKQALMYKDSVETRRITTDMSKDGLIGIEQLSYFKLSNTEFIINGKYQSDAVFQRYRKKYVPPMKKGEEWVWAHNFNNPPVKH